MAQASDTNYSSFEVTVIGKEVSFTASRDRGKNQVNGIIHPGLVSIKRNPETAELLPWYEGQNNEPEYLMTLISNNPTLLGLLLTKCTILHGQGLTLFKGKGEQKIAQDFQDWPEEIRDFYEFNDLNNFTYRQFCDFEMLGNFFPHLLFSKGSSKGGKKVLQINRMHPECVRAYKPADGFGRISKYAISPTWIAHSGPEKPQTVNAYYRRDFFSEEGKFEPGKGKAEGLIWHGKREMPCFPNYGIPHWYGARFHVELQNEIPRWHIANMVNQSGMRLQVHVHQAYIRKLMQEINPLTKSKYTEPEIKAKISTLIRDLFTNPANVGKSLLTGYLTDQQGRAIKDIMVEPIRLDTKDEAYVKLEGPNNNKITSSVGVHAALASLVSDKGMSSGSEMTQAWNIECAKAVMTQNMILEPIRFIHRYNEWPADLSWGFQNPSLVTKDIAPAGILPDAKIPTTPQTKTE